MFALFDGSIALGAQYFKRHFHETATYATPTATENKFLPEFS
jgi:hypothetical protein